jgi:hypothetical protein
MFLTRIPSQRRIPTNNLPILRLNQGNSFRYIITYLMKLKGRKIILTRPI